MFTLFMICVIIAVNIISIIFIPPAEARLRDDGDAPLRHDHQVDLRPRGEVGHEGRSWITYIHIYVYMYVHTHVYIYIYIYMHTHIHTYVP